MGPPRFELESLAPKAGQYKEKSEIELGKLDEFIGFRKIQDLSNDWIDFTRYIIFSYLDYVSWVVDKKKTLEYLNKAREKYSPSYYRKIAYQIRKFLTFINVDWAKEINPPPEPFYMPKRVTLDDIENTLSYFRDNEYFLQIKALILLGMNSGLRAEEIYQLERDDIDIENRTVYINHNPSNNQTTKTKRSRVSFFNEETQRALIEYLNYFEKGNSLKILFAHSTMLRAFRNAPILVKDLRKFFSQEWDRRGGATSVKKILMGHSFKNDIDLMHYNYQSEEDLKKIYDKVMGGEGKVL